MKKELAKEYLLSSLKYDASFADKVHKYLDQLSVRKFVKEAYNDTSSHLRGVTKGIFSKVDNSNDWQATIARALDKISTTKDIKQLSLSYRELANSYAMHSLGLAQCSLNTLLKSSKESYQLALQAKKSLLLAKQTTKHCYKLEEEIRKGNYSKLRQLKKAKVLNFIVFTVVTSFAYIYLVLVFIIQLFGKKIPDTKKKQ